MLVLWVHLASRLLSDKYSQNVCQILVYCQILFPIAFLNWNILLSHWQLGCLLPLVCFYCRWHLSGFAFIWLVPNQEVSSVQIFSILYIPLSNSPTSDVPVDALLEYVTRRGFTSLRRGNMWWKTLDYAVLYSIVQTSLNACANNASWTVETYLFILTCKFRYFYGHL